MTNLIVILGHKALTLDFVYDFYQWVVGGKAYRDSLVRSISQNTDVILDLGCGTAASAGQLNNKQKYFGVDISQKYISKAKKRNIPCSAKELIVDDLTKTTWQSKFKDFAAGDSSLSLALGVLHHLNDFQSIALLRNLKDMNAPGSTIFSVDPTVDSDTTPIAKWFAKNDRGKFVRTPSELSTIFKRSGLEADIYVSRDNFEFP